MIARRTSLLAAGLLLAGLAVAPALAEDAMNVTRSAEPQTITGEGDKTLLIEGPFGIEWQSAGRIGVTAAPDRPGQAQGGGPAVMSGPGAGGMAKGAMKLSGQQRYRVSIMAGGPWEVTVSW
ncbi:MAG: hypothetical protein Kow00114_02170 [Kiloniellaceae bacterium]